jgi:hypothetical protein
MGFRFPQGDSEGCVRYDGILSRIQELCMQHANLIGCFVLFKTGCTPGARPRYSLPDLVNSDLSLRVPASSDRLARRLAEPRPRKHARLGLFRCLAFPVQCGVQSPIKSRVTTISDEKEANAI